MTDDSIALRALLEKSAEADLLREAGPARPAFEGALLEPLDAGPDAIASGAEGSALISSGEAIR